MSFYLGYPLVWQCPEEMNDSPPSPLSKCKYLPNGFSVADSRQELPWASWNNGKNFPEDYWKEEGQKSERRGLLKERPQPEQSRQGSPKSGTRRFRKQGLLRPTKFHIHTVCPGKQTPVFNLHSSPCLDTLVVQVGLCKRRQSLECMTFIRDPYL